MDHLEDLGVDGMIVLKWVFEKLDGGMDCTNLDRDGLQALMIAVMNVRVS